jgi:hypothetical protein
MAIKADFHVEFSSKMIPGANARPEEHPARVIFTAPGSLCIFAQKRLRFEVLYP